MRLQLYRGNVFILGRSSDTEKLYEMEESSMDSLENFSPEDTSMSPFPQLYVLCCSLKMWGLFGLKRMLTVWYSWVHQY